MSTEGSQVSKDIYVTHFERNLDNRVTKLEVSASDLKEDLQEVKRDLRWVIGIMLSFHTTIVALLAKGFHWI